jgi:hypothetical protein
MGNEWDEGGREVTSCLLASRIASSTLYKPERKKYIHITKYSLLLQIIEMMGHQTTYQLLSIPDIFPSVVSQIKK